MATVYRAGMTMNPVTFSTTKSLMRFECALCPMCKHCACDAGVLVLPLMHTAAITLVGLSLYYRLAFAEFGSRISCQCNLLCIPRNETLLHVHPVHLYLTVQRLTAPYYAECALVACRGMPIRPPFFNLNPHLWARRCILFNICYPH